MEKDKDIKTLQTLINNIIEFLNKFEKKEQKAFLSGIIETFKNLNK